MRDCRMTRQISISKTKDRDRIVLEYKLGAVQGGRSPKPETCELPPKMLTAQKKDIQVSLDRMVDLASDGKDRGIVDFEATVLTMASNALPSIGIGGVAGPEAHTVLEITDPKLVEIPWEAFHDRFAYCNSTGCDRHHQGSFWPREEREPGFCAKCGKPLKGIDDKLVFTRNVGYVIHGETARRFQRGHQFLIIADPTEELRGASFVEHLNAIRTMLKVAGYEPKIFQGSSASREMIVRQLQQPSLAGVYYIGHGSLEGSASDGALVLAGRRPLFAQEIERLGIAVPFIYLNACYGAGQGKDWSLTRRVRSVAEVFARSAKGAVVIAPTCRISSTYAVPMAVKFFREALTEQSNLANALCEARRESYRNYRDGKPDALWACFRYFGDFERKLEPITGLQSEVAQSPAPLAERLFDSDGKLDISICNFPLDEMLIRAAKRRLRQNRLKITCLDLVAGLLRRGELVRLGLNQVNIDADAAYPELLQLADSEAPPQAYPQDLSASPEALLSQFSHPLRSQFTGPASELLAAADRLAQSRATNAAVTEFDLINAVTEKGKWTGVFPTESSREAMITWLDSQQRRSAVDDNGRILLADLDPRAARIVELAHAIAQQREVFPITHRLMLAAFTMDEDGLAARRCAEQHVDHELLCALMVALGDRGDAAKPENITSVLGVPAAQRVVLPMLGRARTLRNGLQLIDEALLLRAFSEVADVGFKQALLSSPDGFQVDIDQLGRPGDGNPVAAATSTPPSDVTEKQSGAHEKPSVGRPETVDLQPKTLDLRRLDPSAMDLLGVAATWARSQGNSLIRQPHLFVALIGDGNSTIGQDLRQAGLDPEKVKLVMLSLVSAKATTDSTENAMMLSDTCGRILGQAIEIAQTEGRDRASDEDILRAFFVDGGGVVGQTLQKLGLKQIYPWLQWRPKRGPRSGNGQNESLN